jgi:transcriptional regulator with XRE-family HTH domain
MQSDISFSQWLKQLRADLDLTQKALAELVSCHYSLIQMYETYKRRPSIAMAKRLAKCLEVPLDQHDEFIRKARAPLPVGARGTNDERRTSLLRPPSEVNVPAKEREPRDRRLQTTSRFLEEVNSTRLAQRLDVVRQRSFVGRVSELALFVDAVSKDPSPFVVLYMYGPGGIGKSTLLGAFARYCRECNRPVLILDGRNIQPTRDGFLSTLGELTGATDPLTTLPNRVVLLIDTYELLTPLDSWLREHFLPQIPARAIVVLASRMPLSVGWREDAGWREHIRVQQLGNLTEMEAAEYLRRRTIPLEHHESILRFTRGYPLALALAADVLLQDPGSSFAGPPPYDLVHALLERFVASILSSTHLTALEACAEVRVINEPLLAALLAISDVRALFKWLCSLSFISIGPRGIFPHDLARDALVADLKWRNPAWHQELHRRSRMFYLDEFAHSQGHAQQMALLDLIFLHDNPLVRSTFTWSELGGLVEDLPRTEDWPTLIEMVRRHEGEESAELARLWFAHQPEGIVVFRDSVGALAGFNCFVVLRPSEQELIDSDPCTAAIWRFVQSQPPLADGQFIAIQRFWMDRDGYQAISPTQGMIFVTSTRYMLTTPGLAYSFHVWVNADQWIATGNRVFIRRLPEADFTLGMHRYGIFVHDWRAQPPQAWLDALAERETEG